MSPGKLGAEDGEMKWRFSYKAFNKKLWGILKRFNSTGRWFFERKSGEGKLYFFLWVLVPNEETEKRLVKVLWPFLIYQSKKWGFEVRLVHILRADHQSDADLYVALWCREEKKRKLF